ncbi:DUF434 domain-containing protein [Nitratifractor sp.]
MRRHRGPAPEDRLFRDARRLRRLREAVEDLSWLLRRGYSAKAAGELVGNRYQLTGRERLALSHAAWDRRERSGRLQSDELKGKIVCVDGFNLLITLETALGGGVLIRGVDGRLRDLASVHGHYTLRAETEAAIRLALEGLRELGVRRSHWLFDRPVSNSGRLASLVESIARELGVEAEAEAVDGVDSRLKHCDGVVLSADTAILDSKRVQWYDLVEYLIERKIPNAWIVDLEDKG